MCCTAACGQAMLDAVAAGAARLQLSCWLFLLLTWPAMLRRHPLALQIMKEDDSNWPPPDRVGRQELEVVMGNEHISFATTKLGSLLQVGVCVAERTRMASTQV